MEVVPMLPCKTRLLLSVALRTTRPERPAPRCAGMLAGQHFRLRYPGLRPRAPYRSPTACDFALPPDGHPGNFGGTAAVEIDLSPQLVFMA